MVHTAHFSTTDTTIKSCNPSPPPNNKWDIPSTCTNMYCNIPNIEKNKALHPIPRQEESIVTQAIKQSRNFSNTQSDINGTTCANNLCV